MRAGPAKAAGDDPKPSPEPARGRPRGPQGELAGAALRSAARRPAPVGTIDA